MMIKSLAHACLKTADLEKTAAFYCGLLGLEKVFSFTRRGEIIGYYLRASQNTFLEVFLEDSILPASNKQSLHHFCLETEDIQAVRALMQEHGHVPGEVKLGADQSWQFWMKDPNGLDIEFHQYTDRSAQFTGEDVEVNW